MKRNHHSDSIFILIGSGFEETAVIPCLVQMRQVGLPVSLLSVVEKRIQGRHGLEVYPHLALNTLPSLPTPRLILIPDGYQCASELLTEPQVYHLIKKTLTEDGWIASMPAAQSILNDMSVPSMTEATRFLPQGQLLFTDFVEQIIDTIYSGMSIKI